MKAFKLSEAVTMWVHHSGSSQEIKTTCVFKTEVLIQGTDHMDDGRAERVNWPVRHLRDHLDRKPLAP